MVILKRFSRVDFGLVRRRHLCIYHSHVVMRMVGVLYNGVSEGSICIYIYIYSLFATGALDGFIRAVPTLPCGSSKSSQLS